MMIFSPLSKNKSDNRSLWALAWMSFFWSTGSLMIFSLLPIFLIDVLGASKTKLGFIEGVAVFAAFAAKVFSGIISDYFKRRKPFIILGTVGSILTKVIFSLASSITWVFFARTVDRLSKGVRSAPTDALIADLTPPNKEGTSYGARYSLYTLGAVLGGSLAALLMVLSSNNYRFVFWCSLIPVICSLIVLIFYVQPKESQKTIYKKEWNLKEAKKLPKVFWFLILVTAFLMLARFSEAFLNLRAKEIGWNVQNVPLLIVGYDLINAAVAAPIGRLFDRYNRWLMLLMGILILILTNIIMIFGGSKTMVFIGILMAGLHMGCTQGLISALIAQNTLPHLRGTAFAIYYLTTGICVLIGNTVAGFLSDYSGTSAGAFFGGLIFTTCSALLLIAFYKKYQKLQKNP